MRTRILVFGVLATLAAARPAEPPAWGEFGHRLIGEVAAEALPAGMPAFMSAAKAQLSYLNPEPDRWRDRVERQLDPAMDGFHAPEHYIDLELLPQARRQAILSAPTRMAYADSLRSLGANASGAGFLPFRIIELTQVMRADFRLWRAATDADTKRFVEQRIINDAGILGHYVADGSNPAHTTIHHNGWIGTNPQGFTTSNTFHARFESVFVEARLTSVDVRPLVSTTAESFPNVRAAVIAYLERSHVLVERLYQLEKSATFDAQNASAEHKRFAAERLAAGATMLRDLWWTAWATSGN